MTRCRAVNARALPEHCLLRGCAAADGLSALVQWVEQGQAPERVLAQGSATLPASVNRPLCPGPQVARYSGGEVNAAARFACR